MIGVRIRDVEEAEPSRLAQVPYAELDDFIMRLRRDGVYVVGNDATHELSTQWVVDEASKEAYLEIIVGDDSE